MTGLRKLVVIVTIVVATMATVSSCSNQHPIFTSPARYKAPLVYADDPGRLAGYYMVKLHKDYKFEDHMARLGDVQDLVTYRFRNLPEEMYNARGVSDLTLTAIRADPGVAEVVCGRTWEFRE